MAGVSYLGLRRDPLLDNVNISPVALTPEDAASLDGSSELLRGLRAGAAGMSAGANAYAAAKADAEADAVATAMYRERALEGLRQAQLRGPRVRSYKDVDSVDDALDYGAGMFGSGAVTTLPAVAGAVAGRGLGRFGSYLGGFAASALPEAGEAALTQQQDPALLAMTTPEERLSVARVKGLGSAALETLIPAATVDRIGNMGLRAVRRGPLDAAKHVGGTVALGAGGEALTEMGQTRLGQAAHSYLNPERDTSDDRQALVDAAIGGALVGGPLSGLGGAAEVVGNNLAAASGAAVDASGNVIKKIPKVVDDAMGDAVYGFSAGEAASRLRDTAELPDELIEGTPEQIMEFEKNDSLQRQAAADVLLGEMIADKKLPPAARERAKEMRKALKTDPSAWGDALTFAEGIERGAKVRKAAGWLKEWTASKFKGGKENRQRTDADRVMFGEMMKFVEPDMTENVSELNTVYDAMRDYVASGFDGARPLAEFAAVFGERTVDALTNMAGLMRRAGQADVTDEQMAKLETQLAETSLSQQELEGQVRENLDLKWGDPTDDQVTQYATALRYMSDAAEGKQRGRAFMTPAMEKEWIEKFDAGMGDMFGPNAARMKALLLKGRKVGGSSLAQETSSGSIAEKEQQLSSDDLGSDKPEEVFQRSMEESDGPQTRFVGSNEKASAAGASPGFWNFKHGDKAVAASIKKRYAAAKARFSADPKNVVLELTPMQYARSAGKPLFEVARMVNEDAALKADRDDSAAMQKILENSDSRMLRVESAAINPDPIELTQADVDNLVKKTVTTLSSKKDGKTAVDTVEEGRFFVRRAKRELVEEVDQETGEIKTVEKVSPGERVAISSNELVKMMFQRKTEGAFDERTMELQGNRSIQAMFAAGLSSLLTNPAIYTEDGKALVVKESNGKERLIKGASDLGPNFVIMQRSEGGKIVKTRLGNSRAFVPGAEERQAEERQEDNRLLAEDGGLGDEDGVEEATGEVDAETGEDAFKPRRKTSGMESLVETEVLQHARTEVKDEIIKRRKQPDGKMKLEVDKEGGVVLVRPEVTRTVLKTETEVFGEATAKKLDKPRKFDEFGNEVQPRVREPSAKAKALKAIPREEFLKNPAAIPAATVEEAAQDQGVSAKAVDTANRARAALQPLWRSVSLDLASAAIYMQIDLDIDTAMRTGDWKAVQRRLAGLRNKLGLTKQNRQAPGAEKVSLKTQKEIKAYVKKVLGPKIKVIFSDTLKGSGLWTDANGELALHVAMTALNPLSVAHHESVHGLFSMLMKSGDKEVTRILTNAASSASVRRQLERLLAGQDAALEQLSDPEERVAYMYQFWAAGQLTVGPETKGVFQRVLDTIRSILQLLSTDQQAQEILEAFLNGDMSKPSAVGAVMADINGANDLVGKTRKFLQPALERANELVGTSEGLLRDSDNPHLAEVATQFNTATDSTEKGLGFFQAKAQKTGQFLNRFEKAVGDAQPKDLAMALEALQKQDGVAPKDPVARKIYEGTRALLDDMLPYLRGAGMEIGELKNYFTRAWNMNEVTTRADEFKARLLEKYSKQLKGIARAIAKGDKKPTTEEDVAAYIVATLTNTHGVDMVTADGKKLAQWTSGRDDIKADDIKADEDKPGYTPFMKALGERSLDFIKDEDFLDFFEKDLVNIVSAYVVQGVKRAEYTRRFDEDGGKLEGSMQKALAFEYKRAVNDGLKDKEAKEEAIRRMRAPARAVLAMEGVLGADINPSLRRASSAVMVYQNLRLLPLSLFSSVVDPLGIVVRGGEMTDALAAFKRGIKEVVASIKGDRSVDEAAELAEMLGTVDAGSFLETLGETYSSVYMYGWQKKLNGAIFKWNGMEGWNRGMRIAATQTAVAFIKRHVERPNEHSERYLSELGLTSGDVRIENGRLLLSRADGLSVGEEARMHAAVMRWVDGAVLRPNAAQRPAWASDPHWALLFHLKQFMYSFQKTILRRAATELKHGNYNPLLTLAFVYVPVMIASDIAKGILVTLGDEPEWKKGWGPGDYVTNGIQRAGLLGVPQMAVDAYSFGGDSLFGPTAEQLVSAASAPVDQAVFDAVPVNPVVKGLLQ